MKRAIVFTLLVLSSGILLAQTVNEIPCGVLATGGGGTGSATHFIYATLGQPVTGITGSPGGHAMVHGQPSGEVHVGFSGDRCVIDHLEIGSAAGQGLKARLAQHALK